LAYVAQAAPSSGSCSTMSCGEGTSGQTGGTALLQVAGAGAVGKRASVDEETSPAGATKTKASNQASSKGQTQQKRSDANMVDKKPKKAFDFKNTNNNDNIADGNNNDANLDVSNNNDADLDVSNNNAPLNNNNDVDFDLNNDNDAKDKKGKGGKKDGEDFDFGNNDAKKDKGDKAIDNFDFGEGPVKTEEEKVLAATDRLKKQVSEAISKVSSVLKEAETGEEDLKDAVDKIEKGKEVAKMASDVQKKLERAQKKLRDLQNEMSPSSSHLGSIPHAWLFVGTCMWMFSRH